MAKNTATGPVGREVGRRLSIGELGFDKPTLLKLVLEDQKANHYLARFVGVVSGLHPYKIKEGERAGQIAYGLQGQFKATTVDGESLEGTVCYLPGYYNDAVANVFANNDDVASIQIAVDVYAKFDETSATSYVFTVYDLLNTGSESVKEVESAISALPMPSKTIALEDKTS